MKHRLAALFLAAALFCTLLAGCAPTPDVPGPGGGSSSSGSTNNGGNSESGDNNNTNSPKLQPSIVMEAYNIHSNVKNEHVVSCVFSATNPNTAYSVTRGRVGLTMKDSAGKTLKQLTSCFRRLPPVTPFASPIPTPAKMAVPLLSAAASPAQLLPALKTRPEPSKRMSFLLRLRKFPLRTA